MIELRQCHDVVFKLRQRCERHLDEVVVRSRFIQCRTGGSADEELKRHSVVAVCWLTICPQFGEPVTKERRCRTCNGVLSSRTEFIVNTRGTGSTF